MPGIEDLKNDKIEEENMKYAKSLAELLKATEEERRKLFLTFDGKKRTAAQLSEAERIKAAKLFEFIFGMLSKRPEVQLYKQVHKNASNMDLIFIDNQSMTEIIKNDPEIQRAIRMGKVEPIYHANVMSDFIGAKALEKITFAEQENRSIGFSSIKVTDDGKDLALGEVVFAAVTVGAALVKDAFNGLKKDEEGKKNAETEDKNKEDKTNKNGEKDKDNKETVESDSEADLEDHIEDVNDNTDNPEEEQESADPTLQDIKEYVGYEEPDPNQSVSDRLRVEINSYAIPIYEAENEVNKELKEIQKTLKKERPETEKYGETKRKWQEVIDARLFKLADMYRMKEITEYYFITRAEQLNMLKLNMNVKIPNTPELSNPTVPGSVEAYNNLLLDRLNENIWKDHLKNLPAFIQWKLEQKPENENEPALALRDLDKDGWALLYENACRAEMMKNPPALPAGVVMPRELTEEEKERKKNAETDEEVSKQIVNNSTEEKSYKPAMIALLQQKKLVLGGIERKLGETYINVEAALKENLITDADLKDYAYSPVYNIVANAIALDIVERREDHKVPGGLSFWGFQRTLAQFQGFRNVVRPLIDEIYEQYRVSHEATGENTEKITIYDVPKAKRFVEMLEDHSVINAVAMESKFMKQRESKQGNQGDGGIKHVLEQLKIPPRQPEAGPKV